MTNAEKVALGCIVAIGAIIGISHLVKAGPKLPLGDLNDDGEWTQKDLDILTSYLLGHPIEDISPLSPEEFLCRADVNQDGVVNYGDITPLKWLIDYGKLPP